MLEKLKKDNFFLGFVMGLVVPVVVFTIFYFTDKYISGMKGTDVIVQNSTKYVVAVFFNLVLFRIYMVNWKMDNTGKGLLAMTFFLAIGYLVLFQFSNGQDIL